VSRTTTLTIMPAIDLLGGVCVRLRQGNYEQSTVYSDDPVEQAKRFVDAGATRVHVVDLDAARARDGSERSTNRSRIAEIRSAVSCCIEVGGGVREEQDVRELLDIGVDRIVVGTVLVRRPDAVQEWTARYGPVILAGIDAREGEVRISGWTDSARITDVELARRAASTGVVGIVHTEISRDGMRSGPAVDASNRVAEAGGVPVVVSGGLGSIDDVRVLARERNEYVVGAIAGTAVYEGSLDLKRVFEEFPQENPKEMAW